MGQELADLCWSLGLAWGQQAGCRAGCKALTDITVLPPVGVGTDSHGVSAWLRGVSTEPNARYKSVLVENTRLNHNSHVEVTASYNSSGTMDKLHGLFLVSSVVILINDKKNSTSEAVKQCLAHGKRVTANILCTG